MNPYFLLTDKVYDITERYPELMDFLAVNGFEKITNPVMRKTIGKQMSLETALKSRHVDPQAFEAQMVEFLERGGQVEQALCDKAAPEQDSNALRIEGVLPCPIRIPLLEAFEAWQKESGIDVRFDLQSASMGLDWLEKRIADCKDASELADVYFSAGYSLFFDNEILGRYCSQGVFTDESRAVSLKPEFDNAQLSVRDPNHQYIVAGIVPAVIVVNQEVLGDRPVPQSWSDLTDPVYRNSIAFPVQDLDMFNAFLLGIYAKYGKEGLAAMGQNLLAAMHPAQMVKLSKSGNRAAPAITVMPYFFAAMMKDNKKMQFVWPTDGAILNPIFLMVKTATKEKSQPLVDFILSQHMGKILSADGRFPSTNPLVEDTDGYGTGFLFPGWDLLNHQDVPQLLKDAESAFFSLGGME